MAFEEYIEDSIQELKRAEHLIFVSLKYTRTVDVIKSIINRLIDAYNFILEGMLLELKKKKVIDEIPTAPKLRAEIVKQGYPQDTMIPELLNLYLLLRQLNRAEYVQVHEFRRQVAMIAKIDGREFTVNIDTISAYYAMTKDFITHIKKTYAKKQDETK
ncbi:MAG: hypothetical protein QW594_00105 [Candidatus Woesearchaeota archaeon]